MAKATTAAANGVNNKAAQNLVIWNQGQETDPNYTKDFNRGGFQGTAINPTYLIKKATTIFGPVGIGWGWEILEERFNEGHLLKTGNGTRAIVHTLRVSVWYLHPETAERGSVIHFGQTTMVGENKNGPFTDEEAPKKSLTDAIGKALAALGLSADIHLGLYDDNKYVNNLERKFAEPAQPTAAETRAPTEDENAVQDFLAKIKAAPHHEELDAVREEVKPFHAKLQKEAPILAKQLASAIANRRAELGPRETQAA